jgi:hypothetical protein
MNKSNRTEIELLWEKHDKLEEDMEKILDKHKEDVSNIGAMSIYLTEFSEEDDFVKFRKLREEKGIYIQKIHDYYERLKQTDKDFANSKITAQDIKETMLKLNGGLNPNVPFVQHIQDFENKRNKILKKKLH